VSLRVGRASPLGDSHDRREEATTRYKYKGYAALGPTRPLARLGPWPDSALGPLRSALGPSHALPQEPGPSSRPLPWSPPQNLDWAGLFRPGGGQLAQTRPMARYVCGLAVPLTCRCKLAAAAMHSGRQGARLTEQGPRPGAPDGHCAIPPGSTSSECHRGLCWWCYAVTAQAPFVPAQLPPGWSAHDTGNLRSINIKRASGISTLGNSCSNGPGAALRSCRPQRRRGALSQLGPWRE
jgi:hypothetical protein